jgi:putative sugar O-methyltransferase
MNQKLLIDKYLLLTKSKIYNLYVNENPASHSWREYIHDFKNIVLPTFQNKETKDILNSLFKSGSINSPYNYPDQFLAVDSLNYHIRRLSYKGDLSNYFPNISEEGIFSGNAIIEISDGRKFSLDTFRYLAYVEKIETHLIKINNVRRYMELGSGNGGFTRVIKLLNPSIKCILIDLPEILFTSCTYLMYCFPKANHLYIIDSHEIKAALESDADFIYVSNHLFEYFANSNLEIDLFCNMRSIGEMPQKYTEKYEQIFKRLNINNIFLENRYLNLFSPLHRTFLNYRKTEITGSTWMKDNWNTIDFDLEPSWTLSPYESDHPRYLSLCLSKNKPSIFDDSDNLIIEKIQRQYWRSKNKKLRPWNLAYHPLNFDQLTLSVLWEKNRKSPTSTSLILILDYIYFLFKSKNVEEYEYYNKQLKDIFGINHKPFDRESIFSIFIRFSVGTINKIKKVFGIRPSAVLKEYE